MDFTEGDVKTLGYPERRLIVVAADEAVEVARRAPSDAAGGKWALDIATSLVQSAARSRGGPASAAGAAAATVIATAALQLWRTRKRAASERLPFLVITDGQAANLTFPNGHPLRNVVYVGDPGVASNYYPVADFHRVLFSGKVAEVLRLLRSLGATDISIEYLEGFDRGASIDFSAAPPGSVGVEVRGDTGITSKTSSGAKFTMKLLNHPGSDGDSGYLIPTPAGSVCWAA